MTKLLLYGFFALLGSLSVQSLRGKISAPTHFPATRYDFQKNPLSTAKINLGRALFYDPILSRDNSISCASCHSPFNAFAHSDHALSHGIDDSIGHRNAPALFNLAWQNQFMWDAAINHLDMQALAPLLHQSEMGSNLSQTLQKLAQSSLYTKLFEQAWGDPQISSAKLLKSLSAFQLTLISAGSKYDQVMLGDAQFNVQEDKGHKLFKIHCNRCHQAPLFSNYKLANNGLPFDANLMDMGRFEISKNEQDIQLFKTPSLRNLQFSAPYMHDGRFSSLREVLTHYNIPKKPAINLDSMLQKGLPLNDIQKTDLIAFLQTLNDPTFIFNPSHRFPRDLLLAPSK